MTARPLAAPLWGDAALWWLVLRAPVPPVDVPDLARPGTGAPPLFAAQEGALRAMATTATLSAGPWGPYGALLLLGCGHGKSLLSYVAPEVYGVRRPVLMVPASLRSQTIQQYAAWSRVYRCGYPPKVLSYETLSSLGRRDVLQDLNPDLIVLDEFHMLGNSSSARWRRLARYVASTPSCRVVALSGTAIVRSIKDMGHIAHACLRDLSPLPTGRGLELWSEAIDLGTEPSADVLRYMAPLCHVAAEPVTKRGTRRAYKKHMSVSTGVTMTSSVSCAASLRIELWKPSCNVPVGLASAVHTLKTRWELPDRRLLVDAFEMDRHTQTLPLGFYTRHVPPVDPGWASSRKNWERIVRRVLDSGNADSPGEAAQQALQGRLGNDARACYESWLFWRNKAPNTEAVWTEDGGSYVLDVLTEYLKQQREPGSAPIIWLWSRALGVRCTRWGFSYYGQGSTAPTRALSDQALAMSWRVHGKGWNGQAYWRQLALQGPTNAAQLEQLLCRTHRPGQTHDVVFTHALIGPWAEERWQKLQAGAHFLQDTTGEPQRALFASVIRTGA